MPRAWAKKVLTMLFWPILGHWCPVVTVVTFSNNLSNLIKRIQKFQKKIWHKKNIKSKIFSKLVKKIQKSGKIWKSLRKFREKKRKKNPKIVKNGQKIKKSRKIWKTLKTIFYVFFFLKITFFKRSENFKNIFCCKNAILLVLPFEEISLRPLLSSPAHLIIQVGYLTQKLKNSNCDSSKTQKLCPTQWFQTIDLTK